jgi:hypothetical protein
MSPRRPLNTLATTVRRARHTIAGHAHRPVSIDQRVRRAVRIRTGGR